MNRFSSVSQLTEYVIEQYEAGTPLESAGMRGFINNYFYAEGQGKFSGQLSFSGAMIQSASAAQYVETIHHVLKEGFTVDFETARSIGALLMCTVSKGSGNATKTVELQDERTIVADSDKASEPTDVPAVPESTDADSDEVPEDGGDNTEDVSTSDAVEAPLDDTAAESNDAVQVDWDHAESLVKKDLDKYAETFGHNLDGRKSKAKMLAQFKELASEG